MPAAIRRIRPALVALLLTIFAGAQQSVPPQPGRAPAQSSTSGTGQFTIHGSDLATRSAFCLMCDEVAAALGRLLRDDARYLLPVVIVLKSPVDAALTGPAVTWNISQLSHGGFHLQINAILRSEFRGDDFAREVVRVLLAERILRGHNELKTARQNVLPNWVLTGVTHALEFRGRSRPSVLFAAVFRSGQIYSVDKILSADPSQLDAFARGVYETSACALVLALLDQTDGPVRFAKFLDALARNDKSDRELLRQLFPTLGASKNSLEKWWSLQMATLATPSALETLGIDETEARLRDALMLVFEPLPDKQKKKAEATPPVSGVAPPDKSKAGDRKKEEEAKSNSNRPPSGAPFIGGRKILFVPVSDSDTDGAASGGKKTTPKPGAQAGKASPEKGGGTKPSEGVTKPATQAGKPNLEKGGGMKISEKPTIPPKEPGKKADVAIPASKEETPEKTEPKKRSILNPLNWFRGKPKAPEETPVTKDGAPEAKKTSEPPAGAPRQAAPPAPGREPATEPVTRLPLDEFSAIWKREDRDKIFQRTINQLNALRFQAHPLYRPLIGEYTTAARLLLTGKQKGIAEKLASLREQRAKILEQARAVESHLDWYEASQTRRYSGAFDDYLKLGDQIEHGGHDRNDALSKYLDTMEKEYEN